MGNLVGAYFGIIGPLRAARHDLCSAVLSREIGNCPNRIELWFNMRQMLAPGPAVPVNGLRRLTAANSDDLGQMQLHTLAKGGEKFIAGGQNTLIGNQLAAFLRAQHQPARSGRFASAKIILPVYRGIHIGVRFAAQCTDKIGADNIVEDQRAISFQRLDNNLWVGIAFIMFQFGHVTASFCEKWLGQLCNHFDFNVKRRVN